MAKPHIIVLIKDTEVHSTTSPYYNKHHQLPRLFQPHSPTEAGAAVTTVRLTTAEVVQHPHVCPIHINYNIFYTSAVTFFI